MRFSFAVAALCLAVTPVMAKPSLHGAAITQFSGDRYIARQNVSTRPSARHAARGRAHKARYYYRVKKRHPAPPLTLAQGFRREVARAGTVVLGGRPSGCPFRAWCGCWLASHFGIRDRSLWLARNWARVGSSAGGPRAGAIVVWRHHVGKITAVSGHRILVLSGNDGRAVRQRWRTTAGVIAYRMRS